MYTLNIIFDQTITVRHFSEFYGFCAILQVCNLQFAILQTCNLRNIRKKVITARSKPLNVIQLNVSKFAVLYLVNQCICLASYQETRKYVNTSINTYFNIRRNETNKLILVKLQYIRPQDPNFYICRYCKWWPEVWQIDLTFFTIQMAANVTDACE